MSKITTIDELHMDDFVKINQVDGKVVDRMHFSGKIVNLSRAEGRFEVRTVDYVIGLGFDMDDMDIEIHKLKNRPKGWKDSKKSRNQPKIKDTVTPTIKTIINCKLLNNSSHS